MVKIDFKKPDRKGKDKKLLFKLQKNKTTVKVEFKNNS